MTAPTGEVPVHTVISVLKAHGVEVQDYCEEGHYILAKGERLEVVPLQASVRRNMLHAIARKYDIPVHHFFNPLMAPSDPKTPIQ